MELLVDPTPARRALTTLRRELEAAPDVRQAAREVVKHLAAQGLMPSFYLEQGGRLRCQAVCGYWQIFDGMRPETGVIGRTFHSGEPTVETQVAADTDYLAAVDEVVAEVCVPVQVEGRVVGVLNAESTQPLGPGAAAEVTRCAALLGERLAGLAPLDVPSPAQAMARIGARLATLYESDAILAETAAAASELSGFSSAMVALSSPDVRCAVGPLASVLGAIDPDQLERMASCVEGGTSSYTTGDGGGRGGGNEPLRRAGTAALAVFPLTAAGRHLGLLVLADGVDATLDTDIVELLELLATQAASVLGTVFALDELRRRAERDALTDLGHHATFNSELRACRRDSTGPVATVLVDVDDFKSINDDRGHASGDAVLRDTASLLREIAAGVAGGQAYRIGGDEFAVVAPVESASVAAILGQRICDAARERLGGVRLSAGVALALDDETDSELMARADAALYAAKRAGRDRAVLSPRSG